MKAFLTEKGTELGYDISLATSLTARMRGLLGKQSITPGEGLLISPCMGIHTFFMKFSIDAVFLDKNNRIIALFRNLAPNRLTPIYRKAASVLELPAGTLGENSSLGDKIHFSD